MFAGFAVVLPEPVWESWGTHLGRPDLQQIGDPGDRRFRLGVPVGDDDDLVKAEPAWIIVFRIDRASSASPRPLAITMRIQTDSRALLHYAFDVAPQAAIEEGAILGFERAFRRRLAARWNGAASLPLEMSTGEEEVGD